MSGDDPVETIKKYFIDLAEEFQGEPDSMAILLHYQKFILPTLGAGVYCFSCAEWYTAPCTEHPFPPVQGEP